MLENVKAVLFDLDGTLVDSMWMWKDIDIEYLGKYGIILPEELQRLIEGMSFSEVSVYFKETFGLKESLEEIKAEWISMAKDKYAHEVPLKPGAIRFLDYLRAHNIRMGIATSNSRELLDAVLESRKIAPYFGCCMTACEAGAGKPAPDIYLKVAKALETEPADCLIFEDTPAGIQAGIRAGIPVCAVADRHSADRKDQILELADYYIETFDQVLDGSYQKLKSFARKPLGQEGNR